MVAYAKVLTFDGVERGLPAVLGIAIAITASLVLAHIVYVHVELRMTTALRAAWDRRSRLRGMNWRLHSE